MGDFLKAVFDAIRTGWKFPATIFIAAVLVLWGPPFLRPDLSNGFTDTPLSEWIRLVVVAPGVAVALIWLCVGIKWTFDRAGRVEDERSRPPVQNAKPVDADAELFGRMEHWEVRALSYFIVMGRSSLPRTTFLRPEEDATEILRALHRLRDREFVTHFNPPYNFSENVPFVLRDDLFRRLSERPALLGLDIEPRHFAPRA